MNHKKRMKNIDIARGIAMILVVKFCKKTLKIVYEV